MPMPVLPCRSRARSSETAMTLIGISLLSLAKPAAGLSPGIPGPRNKGYPISHVRLKSFTRATNSGQVDTAPGPAAGPLPPAGCPAGGGGAGPGAGAGAGAFGAGAGAGAFGAGALGAGAGAGAFGAGAGAAGAGAGAGGGGASGRTDSARAFAPLTSTGSFAVPSHTTNQRWFADPCGAFGPDGPITPAQIWPLGLVASLNLTS